ncbi:MAG: hypothetical protein ABNH02_09415 [Pseudomonadales bacterium]
MPLAHNKAKQHQSLRSLDSLALALLYMASPLLHKIHNHKSAVVGGVMRHTNHRERTMNYKNAAVSLILGLALSYSFVWIVGIGAGAVAPDALAGYTYFALNVYPNLLIIILSSVVSMGIVAALHKTTVLKADRSTSLALVPIFAYLIYLLFTIPAAILSIGVAAVPAIAAVIYISFLKEHA